MADNSLTKPPTLPLHEQTLNSAITRGDTRHVNDNSLVIVGFPYVRMNCTLETPTMFRDFLEYYKFGPIYNVEYDQDLSKIHFIDVGDIVAESEDWIDEMSLTNQLVSTVSQCRAKRATTFVIGGSHDLITQGSTEGVLHNANGCMIVHIIIGSRIGTPLFHDLVRQYHHHFANGGHGQNLPMKIILFGAQSNHCDATEIQFITLLGSNFGEIYWMEKDIRSVDAYENVMGQFESVLSRIQLEHHSDDILITIDTACIAAPLFTLPTTFAPEYLLNPQGFRVGELLQIALSAGANEHVRVVTVTQHNHLSLATASPTNNAHHHSYGQGLQYAHNPEASMEENSPFHAIIPELFYHFAIGLSSREQFRPSQSNQQQPGIISSSLSSF